MSQKSILSFFKSPSGNVKKICDKELHTKKLSLKNIPAAESPEKDIGFRSIKKARQIIESDEEICEEPFLDDKSPECMLAENGKQSINDQSENENDPLENDAGDPPERIVCKTAMKWGERSDNDKSKIDKIYDKSDVFSECTLKMNVVDATVETKEMKDNRTKAQQLYDDVTCKNDETFNENSVLKRKRCVNISNQNKTLRREKTKLETQPEVQEQLISEKDINASHCKEQSNSKKKIVKKRKNFESKKTSNENVCKKQKQVKIIGKKDKKIKSHTKNYSSENESDPNDTSVSVSHGVKADDSPEVKRMEKDDVSNESSQFHRFFTNHKGQKDKFSRTLKKIVSQGIEEEKPCSSAQKVDTDYQPCKSHYHPIDDACWKRNEKVPYLALAKTMESMENISGRLKIIEILSNFLRSVIVLTPDDLLYSVYLCLNKLAPEYMGIEMGVGETLLMKAVAQATGRTVDKIKTEVNLKGDLGLVAENCRGNQRVMFAPPKLTVSSVFLKFREIAQMSGNAAMTKKVDKIQALFVACRLCEAKYIIRSLSGKLRIGLAEQSVLAALAQAAILTPPNQAYPPKVLNASLNMSADAFKKKVENQSLILKSTYCECPNYDMMIPILLKEGIEGLPKHCHLTPGIPLKPMLAHPTKGIDEVLRRFENNEFTCEFKYDGERAQIHVMDGCEVKIYSRNQEDNTSKYPDVVSRFSKALKSNTKSCILDSEAVAWNHEDKQILPFQVLSTRKKKDAVKSEIVVQVCIVAFDLLYLNGESLVKHPLKERRRLLYEHFNEVENEFLFVKSMDGNSEEIMQDFLNESIKGNCEGLMVKSLEVDASYEIAKRSHNWLKLKKDYLDGVGDTLDLVVIGGFHGKGKRCGGYGGFLLACYDDENEEFQSICKIGTGIKEEEFESHTSFFKQHVIVDHKQYYRFDNSLKPDAWFEPVQVWEVKCADLSISPVHKAAVGLVDPEKGISLRFPRFLRIRDDKKSEEATTSTEVARMYSNQEQVQNQKCKAPKLEDEDFY